MPPRRKFDPIAVIEAAFRVLARDGFSAITARSVAKELGSSTTPIYWVLESMDHVEAELRLKALTLLAEYQVKKYTDNVFVNMAVGYVEFARCEANLFRFIFIERLKPQTKEEEDYVSAAIIKQLGAPLPFSATFGTVDQSTMDAITLHSWIFTHGLAVAVSSKLLSFETTAEIETLLRSAGSAFVAWQTSQNYSQKNN